MSETLTEAQVRDKDLTDWQIAGTTLRTRLRTGDFATGLRLLNLIGQAAEAAPHPPYADTCPQERDSAETENPVQAAESHLTQTTKTPTGRDPVRVTASG